MRSCSNIAGIYIYIYDILMQHQWKKRTLTVPRSQKNKYCRSKTKPGFRLGIWGLDDVWWELALRIPHSWLENWRLGVGPNPLSQPRPFCSFLGCVMPEFFFLGVDHNQMWKPHDGHLGWMIFSRSVMNMWQVMRYNLQQWEHVLKLII